uniref:Uncharacterized protein n=1 Tax=Timema poppense TaxID=170557 RepID=A0A7R9D4L0_TIMPO|nr:unnamed protein product [Timema poppensis]
MSYHRYRDPRVVLMGVLARKNSFDVKKTAKTETFSHILIHPHLKLWTGSSNGTYALMFRCCVFTGEGGEEGAGEGEVEGEAADSPGAGEDAASSVNSGAMSPSSEAGVGGAPPSRSATPTSPPPSSAATGILLQQHEGSGLLLQQHELYQDLPVAMLHDQLALRWVVGYCCNNTRVVGYCRNNTRVVGYCRNNTRVVGYCRNNTRIVGYYCNSMEGSGLLLI